MKSQIGTRLFTFYCMQYKSPGGRTHKLSHWKIKAPDYNIALEEYLKRELGIFPLLNSKGYEILSTGHYPSHTVIQVRVTSGSYWYKGRYRSLSDRSSIYDIKITRYSAIEPDYLS